jgi:hypothetical protein
MGSRGGAAVAGAHAPAGEHSPPAPAYARRPDVARRARVSGAAGASADDNGARSPWSTRPSGGTGALGWGSLRPGPGQRMWSGAWPGGGTSTAGRCRGPAHASRAVKVREQTAGGFTLAVRLPGLGKVRVVGRVATAPRAGGSVVSVPTRVDWRAAKSIGRSWHRGPPATCVQDRQGPWGFSESCRRRIEAMGNPGWVVFVADARRHLTGLPAGPDRTQSLLHTIGDACRHHGRAWRQQLWVFVHDQGSHGAAVDHVLARLLAKQRLMAPV